MSTSAGRGRGDGSSMTAHATALIIAATAYVTASSAISGIHLVEGVVVEYRGGVAYLPALVDRTHSRT
jgi:hypothetical protein